MAHWVNFNLQELFRRCDWTDTKFQFPKSHFLCALSKLAYASIPELEFSDTDRAKLIPCIEYQETIRVGSITNVEEIIRGLEFTFIFEIQSTFAIALGFKIKEILFVSCRGTQRAYDWLYNLDVRKYNAKTPCGTDFEVHCGFHRAAIDIAPRIADYLIYGNGSAKFKKVVFCGHSLGGAISANLFAHCTLCAFENRVIKLERWNNAMHAVASEAYVFGAPRFICSSSHAISNPLSVVNHGDIVPTLPPKFLGYKDYEAAFDCFGQPYYHGYESGLRSSLGWLASLTTFSGIQRHSIEEYIDNHGNRTI